MHSSGLSPRLLIVLLTKVLDDFLRNSVLLPSSIPFNVDPTIWEIDGTCGQNMGQSRSSTAWHPFPSYSEVGAARQHLLHFHRPPLPFLPCEPPLLVSVLALLYTWIQ